MLTLARQNQQALARTRADASPTRAAVSPVHELQRTIGNRAVQRLMHLGAAPASMHDVVRGPGQRLDDITRHRMESRFGHDFANVRVHAGPAAAESVRSIHARAYTRGQDIVFGERQYDPASDAGQHLIAHELAHVVQQRDGLAAGMVQRAEVDDRQFICDPLTDIESEVDKKVNDELAEARKKPGTSDLWKFLIAVMERLGKGLFSLISPIEQYIDDMLGPTQRYKPPLFGLKGTKYEGTGAKMYVPGVVGSTAKVAGVCIGTDKLGHLFQEGLFLYALSRTSGKSVADAEAYGRYLELTTEGLGIGTGAWNTGVYSNADLAANISGMRFYEDLDIDPNGLVFKIRNYIGWSWNEQANPSYYEATRGEQVWQNLLTGKWRGTFTTAGGLFEADDEMTLTAIGSSVTGTYLWPPPPRPAKQTGKIKNGVITQRTTAAPISGTDSRSPTTVSASPVIGVTITFDWEEGTSSGKGVWTSVNEHTLAGTYGSGTSTTGSGTWDLEKL